MRDGPELYRDLHFAAEVDGLLRGSLGMDSVGQASAREEEAAWKVLRACQAWDVTQTGLGGLAVIDGKVREVAADHASALVRRTDGGWSAAPDLPQAASDMLDLYLPFCRQEPVVVAHLGQSLDGFVGTASGDSSFVNDPANITHLHRMRALCDAVVVGGATVRADDPRLTTRRVSGPNPLRVVIDPRRELDPGARVFRDGEAPTLRISTVAVPPGDANGLQVGTDRMGRVDLAGVIEALATRNVRRVFVEGGGITVSRFLEADLLDRLQVTVAPFVIGSGRPGLRVPGTDALQDCKRPSHRLFKLGDDVLFDLDLRAPPAVLPRGGRRAPRRF